MGCAGMSKAAKNSGTGLILTEDEGVLHNVQHVQGWAL